MNFLNNGARAWALIATLAMFFVLPGPAWADIAGEVTRLRGAAAVRSETQERQLRVGAEIHQGETIITGTDSRLELTFGDGTTVTLGDNSELRIDSFIYKEFDNAGEGLLTLAKGVFRAVSGQLARFPGAPLRVKTPIATIGIRGTEFWGEQKADNLIVALLGGKGVYVENAAGRVDITEALFATQVTSATIPPSQPFRLTDEQLKAAVKTVAW